MFQVNFFGSFDKAHSVGDVGEFFSFLQDLYFLFFFLAEILLKANEY